MPTLAPPTTYTTSEAAALVGVSRQTLYRVAQRGEPLLIGGEEVWPIRAMSATRWPAAALQAALEVTPREAARVIEEAAR